MVLQPLPNIGNTTLDPIRPMLSPNDVYDLLVCMSPLYTFLYFPMVSGCVWKQGINDNDENPLALFAQVARAQMRMMNVMRETPS